MPATFALLHLAGYVALLLWGMHMVHSGIVRAYGGHLRQALGLGLQSRWKAFLAGMGITALLQSSTATALMPTSFIAAGFMTLVPALAVTLGANAGQGRSITEGPLLPRVMNVAQRGRIAVSGSSESRAPP